MIGSLFGRLAVILTVLALAAAALLIHFSSRSEQRQAALVQQTLHRELAANMVSDNPALSAGRIDKAGLENAFHTLMLLGPAFEIYVLDNDGRLRVYSAEPGQVKAERVDLAPLKRFLADAALPVFGDDPRAPGQHRVFSAAPIRGATGQQIGYLYVIVGGSHQAAVASSLASRLQQDRALLFGLGGVILLVLLGGALFALMTRPLSALSREMADFRHSGFSRNAISRHLPGWHSREVTQLQASFAELAERVVDQLDQIGSADALRRELLAQIAHDLKTPLAALQGYLETWLLQHPGAADRDYIDVSLRSSRQLSRLVDQLLELARLEARQEGLTREPVAVAELAQDVVAKFALEAQAKGVSCRVDTEDQNLTVSADIAKLERVFTNLIENALRYTPAGGEVVTRLRRDGDAVAIEIADNGRGIPADKLRRIFLPRYRINHAESGESAGDRHLGLGLAIVERLLALHGSDISVRSEPGHGTVFGFVLPGREATS